MAQRAITREYIVQAIRSPMRSFANVKGRRKVIAQLRGRKLVVVFMPLRTSAVVVTAFWED
jgi:hypothetical protein